MGDGVEVVLAYMGVDMLVSFVAEGRSWKYSFCSSLGMVSSAFRVVALVQVDWRSRLQVPV